jgi:hypothetical protein
MKVTLYYSLTFEFDYRVEQKMENKNICGSGNSMIENDTLPYKCQSQEWLTSKGGERTHLQNNIKAKPEQLKLSKTYPLTWR